MKDRTRKQAAIFQRCAQSMLFAGMLIVAASAPMAGWTPQDGALETLAARLTLPLPDKPSLAVLPFASPNAEFDYYADGVTEELIGSLSRNPGLFVIAANSTFRYKNTPANAERVAEALGVRYVVEGSVQRAGDRVRVNARLIDPWTRGQVWAERYDATTTDIVELPDEVSGRIAHALAVSIANETQRATTPAETTAPEAHDALLRGWRHYRSNTPEGLAKALPFLEQALETDPDYGAAHAALAAVYWSCWENEWVANLGLNHTQTLIKAKKHLSAARKQPSALAHQVASRMRVYENRHELALKEAEQALALDANDPLSHLVEGIALVYSGSPARAEARIREAIRLDPLSSDYLFWLGLALLGQDELEPALEVLDEFTERNPDDYWGFLLLGATHGLLQQGSQALAALDTVNDQRARLGDGNYRLEHLQTWPFLRSADRERIRNGLIIAGVY